VGAEVVERVVALTQTGLPGSTYWTAEATGVNVSSVQRIWRGVPRGLQPHRLRQFKLSTDPQFNRPEALHLTVDSDKIIAAVGRGHQVLDCIARKGNADRNRAAGADSSTSSKIGSCHRQRAERDSWTAPPVESGRMHRFLIG
jgi:hypothetical protein